MSLGRGVSAAKAVSAARGTGLKKPRNPAAYFRTALREAVPNLEELLASVVLPKGFACGVPADPRSIGSILREGKG